MFLTMNRFKVRPGQEAAFEAIWTGRDSHLPAVKGFVAFHLMKGPEREGYRLYASHTLWDSSRPLPTGRAPRRSAPPIAGRGRMPRSTSARPSSRSSRRFRRSAPDRPARPR